MAMPNDGSGPLDNRLLFRYIGLAYEATKRLAKAELDGRASEFLSQLYLRRLRSVFGDPSAAKSAQGTNFDDVLDALRRICLRRGPDVLQGHVGDFRLDDPTADD